MRSQSTLYTVCLLLLILPVRPAQAGTVVSFDFDDAAGQFTTVPDFLLAPLTSDGWTDQDNTLTSFAGVSGRAAAARDWQDGNAFIFTLQVPAGQQLDLTRFDFEEKASATGPETWRLDIAGQQVAGASTAAGFQAHGEALTLTPLGGTIEIRLSGSAATSASGTWRVDNFSLQGQVSSVPLPAAGLLLASALLLLIRRIPYGQVRSAQAIPELSARGKVNRDCHLPHTADDGFCWYV